MNGNCGGDAVAAIVAWWRAFVLFGRILWRQTQTMKWEGVRWLVKTLIHPFFIRIDKQLPNRIELACTCSDTDHSALVTSLLQLRRLFLWIQVKSSFSAHFGHPPLLLLLIHVQSWWIQDQIYQSDLDLCAPSDFWFNLDHWLSCLWGIAVRNTAFNIQAKPLLGHWRSLAIIMVP